MAPPWIERHRAPILIGILLGAFVLRLFHLFQAQANDPFFGHPSVDPAAYHDWAIRISQGEGSDGRVFFLSPLYSHFLALLYGMPGGPSMFAAKIVQIVLGTANCWLVYAIGSRVWNREVGLVAAFGQSIYGPFVFYESVLLITNVQTPLMLSTVLLLLRAFDDPQRAARWLVAGAALGLSALARPNVLLMGAVVVPGILWVVPSLAIRARVIRAVLFTIGIGALILPVTLRNFIVADDLILVNAQAGINFYLGNGPGADGSFRVPSEFRPTEADSPSEQRAASRAFAEKAKGRPLRASEVSSFWLDRSIDHILEQPISWLQLLSLKLGLFVNQIEISNNRNYEMGKRFSAALRLPLPGFGVIGPLALAGMILGFASWRRSFLLYGVILVYLATVLLFFMVARYRLPCVPYFILFAAYAIHHVISLPCPQRNRGRAQFVLILIVATFLVHLPLRAEDSNAGMDLYNLANKYRELGEIELAIETYELSIERSPEYISAHHNLALTYELHGNERRLAVEAWNRVLALAEKQNDSRYIGRAKLHLEQLERASRNRKRGLPGR